MILLIKIDPIAPRKSLTTWKKLAAWNSITIEAIDKTLFQPGKSFYLVTIVNVWLCYWHKILIPTRTCHKMKIILWLWPCQSLWELIRSFRWGIWWFPSLYNHRYNSSWIQTVKKWFILLCKFVNMESSKLWHLVIFSIAKIYTSTSTVGLCRSKGLKVTSCQSWRSQQKVCRPALAPPEPVGPDSSCTGVKSFSKFEGRSFCSPSTYRPQIFSIERSKPL